MKWTYCWRGWKVGCFFLGFVQNLCFGALNVFILPPTFVRCLSCAGMPLPFFGKGLAQLCSPIVIAIARLVYACVLSCWIWLCLWHGSIHFLASILWVGAKHCPHLHYALWSSCCGLWILQQIVLGNGCRNDEPTSFHGLSLDSMELHQILARSQLWRLQKSTRPNLLVTL